MALFRGRSVDALVTAVRWSRTVQLERLEWVAKRSDWGPPEGARNVKQHTETYWASPTDPVSPSAPTMTGGPGAGVSPTRTELRTRVYYTYEAQVWHKGRSLQASGYGGSDAKWPDYTLQPGERVRDRRETYSVTFTAGDKQYEKEFPEQEWHAFAPGDACHLSLGLLGGVKNATPVRGQAGR
jgi:hypothetical protein